jgi:hypothetical protein
MTMMALTVLVFDQLIPAWSWRTPSTVVVV